MWNIISSNVENNNPKISELLVEVRAHYCGEGVR